MVPTAISHLRLHIRVHILFTSNASRIVDNGLMPIVWQPDVREV